VDCYDRYVRYNELSWSRPIYRREDPIIRLPTGERIDRIISSCHLKHCLEFTLIKEAGLRPIELHILTLKEIDLETGIISVRTAKHGKARVVKIRPRTLGILKTYVSKHNKGLSDNLFSDPKTMSKAFQRARDRTAIKYQDPECFKVRLYDLRHYYGSMLYHDTKDLLYVKEKMGHRSISSTMRYMHLVEFEESDQYIVKVAKTLDEYTELLELGYNYISDFEGMKVLRKRK
jgi:integrase